MVKEKIKEEDRKIAGKKPAKEKKEEEKGAPKIKEEIKFVAKKEGAPLRVKKVKFKSQKDIEEELENLAKDFTKTKD